MIYASKVMASIFWAAEEVLLAHYLGKRSHNHMGPCAPTPWGSYRRKSKIQRGKPTRGLLFHQHNDPAHTSTLTKVVDWSNLLPHSSVLIWHSWTTTSSWRWKRGSMVTTFSGLKMAASTRKGSTCYITTGLTCWWNRGLHWKINVFLFIFFHIFSLLLF